MDCAPSGRLNMGLIEGKEACHGRLFAWTYVTLARIRPIRAREQAVS